MQNMAVLIDTNVLLNYITNREDAYLEQSVKIVEIEVTAATYVTISAFQMGIGTGICGPKTAQEYCYPMNRDYELRFMIQVDEL